MKLLGEMNNNVKQVSDLVESMLQRVKSGELTTEYGLSFLEVRYHMLLTYLINLTYVVLRKCSGTIFNIWNRLFVCVFFVDFIKNHIWFLFLINEKKPLTISKYAILIWFSIFNRMQAKRLNEIHLLIVWLKFEPFWRRYDRLTISYAIKSINWSKRPSLAFLIPKIQSISR